MDLASRCIKPGPFSQGNKVVRKATDRSPFEEDTFVS
ncbi:MAG: hypothetical protein K0S39_1069 [Paenibacillus sp.]|jgi:hypothetical protein|nr:hypothetical protein [Paenibacillus sp.]